MPERVPGAAGHARPPGAGRAARGDDLVGVAVDVTDDGALVVRDDAGTDHIVTTADVVHLRHGLS